MTAVGSPTNWSTARTKLSSCAGGGEHTPAEFAVSDLLDIVGTFAAVRDAAPLRIIGRFDCRALISPGRLVHAVRVRGQLSPVEAAIELTDIVVDLHGPYPEGLDSQTPDPAVASSRRVLP